MKEFLFKKRRNPAQRNASSASSLVYPTASVTGVLVTCEWFKAFIRATRD